MNTRVMNWSAACGLMLLPALAQAHPGHGAGMSFAAGALHPLAGLDHLAALIATGVLAGRLGKRAGLTILVTFPALLALGAIGGLLGVELAATEGAILVSIFVLSLLACAPPRRLPVATAALAAAFAYFHGHAHGAEAIAGNAPGAYVLGIIVSSLTVLWASASAAERLAGLTTATQVNQPR